MDSSATSYMAPSSSGLDLSTPYRGKDKVDFGNGNVLPISRIGTLLVTRQLKLQDILIVPHIKKKLHFVSKLLNDYPVYFFFCRSSFAIQDSINKKILPIGTHKDIIYIFNPVSQALTTSMISYTNASFKL